MIIILIIIAVLLFLCYCICRRREQQTQTQAPKGLVGGGTTWVPMVKTITNYEFQRLNLDDFVWAPKRDGIHKIVKVKGTEVYEEQSDGTWEHVKPLEKPLSPGETLLECEDMGDYYIVLDVHRYRNINVSELPYIERVQKSFLSFERFKSQTVNTIKSAAEIINYISTFKDHTDGIILTSKNTPLKETVCYKIKPRTMYTIDVLMQRSNNGVYIPYVRLSNAVPLRKADVLNFDGEPYCRLVMPHVNELTYNPNVDLVALPDFPLSEQMKREYKELHREDLHNKLVEVFYNGIQLYPIRIRDKTNVYYTCIRIFDNIFSPISVEGYFQSAVNEEWLGYIDRWHKLARMIRSRFFKSHVPAGTSIIDLAGGRGGNLRNIMLGGFTNLFIEDADFDALTVYIDKFKNLRDRTKDLYLNASFIGLTEDNTNIVEDMKSRKEFPSGGCDCAIMVHAFHYLCDNPMKIKALRQMLHKLLKRGGKFVILDFDYEAIMERMKNNEVKLGPFTITYNREENEITMPLISINSTGYQTEPPVFYDHLDILGAKHITRTLINYDESEPLTEYLQYLRSYTWTI